MWSAFIWIWWSYSWQTATGRVPGPSAPGVNGACLDWKLPEPWHPHSEPSGETCGYSASCWGLGTVSCIFQPIFFSFLPRRCLYSPSRGHVGIPAPSTGNQNAVRAGIHLIQTLPPAGQAERLGNPHQLPALFLFSWALSFHSKLWKYK